MKRLESFTLLADYFFNLQDLITIVRVYLRTLPILWTMSIIQNEYQSLERRQLAQI